MIYCEQTVNCKLIRIQREVIDGLHVPGAFNQVTGLTISTTHSNLSCTIDI